ncbi:MAG: hypothetical protein RSB35_02340 [Eubacterium sp.]
MVSKKESPGGSATYENEIELPKLRFHDLYHTYTHVTDAMRKKSQRTVCSLAFCFL